MPTLRHCLQNHDLGYLEIVAELWGLELAAPDTRTALPILAEALLDPALVEEIVEALPQNARKALDTLMLNNGWMNWNRFKAEFGELREMGPGRRDREKPYLEPISACEVLWYRSLIGRDFLRRENKLQECAYIPNEFHELLPSVKPKGPQTPGRPATPLETKQILCATDRVLDHTCTLLAALRLEDPNRSPNVKSWQPPQAVIHALLAALKLITSSEQPVPEDARPFLEMPRGEALTWLFQGWRQSKSFNELHLIPNLICEGAWHNNPLEAREHLLTILSEVPQGTWWHIESFIKAVKERKPDFQRLAGDFDSWLIRDAETGESLCGREHWDQVDGALVRFIITGPLHWFGLLDLAAPALDASPTAFRFSNWSEDLLLGKPIPSLPQENEPVKALSDGTLNASVHTSRLARYQLSRFCEWVSETDMEYIYKLTPDSLARAKEQGLRVTHLEMLLEKYGETPPPNLIQALHRWERSGEQARIQTRVILRVDSAKILKALRDSPAGRFLEDPLSPTTAAIQAGSVQKITAALARLGYLTSIESPKPGRNEPEL